MAKTEEELLAAVQEMKAGKAARDHKVPVSAVLEARALSGLSQDKFAEIIDVPVKTLRDWEQGRRQPSGAAMTLFKILSKKPEVLKDLVA